MNKKGLIPVGLFFVLVKKAGGILITGLGAFFFFDKWKEVGFTIELIPRIIFSMFLIGVGLFIARFMFYKERTCYAK